MCVLLAAAIPASATAWGGGDLDRSFGAGGVVFTADPDGIEALAAARDGDRRVVVAGTSVFEGFVLCRYLRNGSLDPGFGSGGRAEEPVNRSGVPSAVAVQADGRIVLAGSDGIDLVLGRYDADGRLDRRFGSDGVVTTRFTAGLAGSGLLALGLQRSGRIVGGGYGIDALGRSTGLLVAYRPNGRIDTRFGRHGFVEFRAPGRGAAELDGLAVLPDGKILVSGQLGGRLLLARRLPDGAPDPGFGGGDGEVLVRASARSAGLAVGPGGRPLLAANLVGRGGGALLLRFRPDGERDRSFGRDGTVRATRAGLEVEAVTALRGGGIALSGSYGSAAPGVAVLRFLRDGSPDRELGHGGFLGHRFGRESVATAAVPEPDGGLLVVGRANRRPAGPEDESALSGAEFVLMRLTG